MKDRLGDGQAFSGVQTDTVLPDPTRARWRRRAQAAAHFRKFARRSICPPFQLPPPKSYLAI